MLLADKIRRIQFTHPEDRQLMNGHLFNHRMGLYGAIKDADARYDFTETALAMASDLKVTTPEGLFKTLQSVLREPKVIWIEAQDRLRQKHLKRLNNTVHRDLAPHEAIPNRVGILLYVHEPGIAAFCVAWDSPADNVRQNDIKRGVREHLRNKKRTKLETDAMIWLNSIEAAPLTTLIDVRNTPDFLSKEEFLKSAKDPEHPDYKELSRLYRMAGYDVPTGVSQTEKEKIAYWNYAQWLAVPGDTLTNADKALLKETGSVETTLQQAKGDVSGELAYLVAMLAVLESEENPEVLNIETRKGKPPRKKARKPEDAGLDKISVVSLNVSGDIREKYERGEQAGKAEGKGDNGTARVRHFVRGHYFWARNGLLTYRIPHWRGSVDPSKKLTVTKVK
ncbi:hypothetical protein ACGYK4_17185 [Sulfitobacter sp. 1A13368]|uniref:hypothetical protein n=1 Tax=Sulfitobacter sp. 1A13368 TaxID=3368593 RepID=UPI003746C5D4